MEPKEIEQLQIILGDTFIDLIRLSILRHDGVKVEHPPDPHGLIDVIMHHLTPLQLAQEIQAYISAMIETYVDDLKERDKGQNTD